MKTNQTFKIIAFAIVIYSCNSFKTFAQNGTPGGVGIFYDKPNAPVNNGKLNIKFRLNINNGDAKGAAITVTKNNEPFKTLDSINSWNSISLDLNNEYLFTCTKKGYITKSLLFDTHVPDGREKGDFAKFKTTVDLHPQEKDSDMEYKQPVGKIRYNKNIADFDYDKEYNTNPLLVPQRRNNICDKLH